MLIVSMDCGTDDPLDAIGCGRLDGKLATPRLEERSQLIRHCPDARHLIPQPGFEQRRVGDGRFPKSKQGTDLGTVPFSNAP
jgi:hypothetical protein